MTRKIVAICLAGIVLAAGLYLYLASRHKSARQAPLANLTNGSLEGFRADFNRAADGVRLLLLISPT